MREDVQKSDAKAVGRVTTIAARLAVSEDVRERSDGEEWPEEAERFYTVR